jgi:stringent starvation protein B
MSEPMTAFNAQKRAIVEVLLPLCPFIGVDAKQPGVEVPDGLSQSDLVLRLGRDPRVMGMPDLEIDDDGFRATISVRGSRHFVIVPWEAVSRCWIAAPYVGPLVAWPEVAQTPKPANKPSSGPALRLVKD